MPLKVISNEIDGWDVIEEHGGNALSNHPTRESAEEAAGHPRQEERISEEGGEPVVVDTDTSTRSTTPGRDEACVPGAFRAAGRSSRCS